jgi:hypothetical protein
MEEIEIILREVRVHLKYITPKAFQALWYSDWDYLSLDLEVVIKDGISYDKKTLKILKPFTFEERVKTGEVELPKESYIAETIGKILADEYNVPFYFPSPKSWDSDCPNWWEQNKGIKCADCGKLVIPSDSEYLPKDICYSCSVQRDSIQRVQSDEKCYDNMQIHVFKDDTYKWIGSYDIDKGKNYSILGTFFYDKFNWRKNDKGIRVVTIDKEGINKFKEFLDLKIDEFIASYKPPIPDEFMDKFRPIMNVNIRNSIYQIRHSDKYYQTMQEFESVNNVINENWGYKLFYKRNMTHKEMSVLNSIKNFGDIGATIFQVLEKNHPILTKETVLATIAELLKLNCIKKEDEKLIISENLKHLLR